jgi:hypothetical protein
MSVSYGGDKITFEDGSTVGSGWAGFKNRIINGAMVIDQRNAGANVSVTDSNQYTLDRWQGVASISSSKFKVEQSSTAPAGFPFSLLATSSSAYSVLSGDYFMVRQKIEGFNTADFGWGTANAQTVTLSFWVRSSLTGTFGAAIVNGGNSHSYPFSYTVNQSNTWEQKTITVPGPTAGTWVGATNGIGLQIKFSLGAGSTYSGTANAWASADLVQPTGSVSLVGTSGATWYITGVQLEKGSQASSFEWRPFGTEFDLCRRYCEVFRYDVEGGIHQGLAQVDGSQRPETNLFYYTKRAAPTITSYNMTGQSLFNNMNNGQVTVNSEVSTYVGTGIRGTNLFWGTGGTCAPGTLSGIGYIILVGTAYIVVSAEL